MSLPRHFLEQMEGILGDETQLFLIAMKLPPPVSIRFNKRKIKTPSVKWPQVPWCSSAFYLPERLSFTADPFFHAGAYYVQEASSMFLQEVLTQLSIEKQPLKILDLCAAPGGKSTLIADAMHTDSILISNEAVKSRIPALVHNMQKWGNANIVVCNNKPEDFKVLKNYFDIIIVDAPCSGEGMFRKDAFALGQWNEGLVHQCRQRQTTILDEIWPCLKPGGHLVYSTCTFNRIENEDVILHMVKNHDAASVRIDTENFKNLTSSYDDTIYGVHFLPHKIEGEGFFISVLQKGNNGGEIHSRSVTKGRSKFRKHEIKTLPPGFLLTNEGENLFATPEKIAPEVDKMLQHLFVVHAGICVGTQYRHEIKLHQNLAWSVDIPRQNFENCDLSYDAAIKFLRGQTDFTIDAPMGMVLCTYMNMNLGFVNNLGPRFNNLYPKEYRIMNKGLTTVQANTLGCFL